MSKAYADAIEKRAAVSDANDKQWATEIWAALERDLSDRGCFNGIDDDVMDELRDAQIITIANLLA